MRDITNDEMVQRLIDAGWTLEDAEKEVLRMLDDAAIEDGMY